MSRIALVTNAHFCSNPRVWKEADALASHGHDVVVVGIWHDERQAALDAQMLAGKRWRHIVAADLRLSRFKTRVARNWHRIKSRAAQSLADFGIHDPHALGYAADRILRCASDERADLTIGHLELGLWAAGRLGRVGRRIGADFEDWHSENLPGGPQWRTRYCREIESQAVSCARHLTATSEAMSSAIASSFCVRPPQVIYNGNVSDDSTSHAPVGPVKMAWFSQTIGMGRGLEDAFQALPRLTGAWTLELIGAASAETRAWLDRSIPSGVADRVSVTAPLHPLDLARAVQENDIGLALEPPCCRNRDLTISNKIIQYLQCGLKVAATDTVGQREALQLVPEGGETYGPGDVEALAAILNHWIGSVARLRTQRSLIRANANAVFGYEHRVPLLLSSVELALAN